MLNIISHQEMQITTTKRYHFTPTKMTITKKFFLMKNQSWQRCTVDEPSRIAGRNVNE